VPVPARGGQRADHVDDERGDPHPGPVVGIDEPAHECNERSDDEPGSEA
jgi:hypothetical protein